MFKGKMPIQTNRERGCGKMSHQGEVGWYPECDVCGCGNLGGEAACLDCYKKGLKERIEETRKRNPYPEDIFIEPTKKEYQKMREAFEKAGLIPDKFFGSFGRLVWNNCLEDVEKEGKK